MEEFFFFPQAYRLMRMQNIEENFGENIEKLLEKQKTNGKKKSKVKAFSHLDFFFTSIFSEIRVEEST